jgi:hypothetical protein
MIPFRCLRQARHCTDCAETAAAGTPRSTPRIKLELWVYTPSEFLNNPGKFSRWTMVAFAIQSAALNHDFG